MWGRAVVFGLWWGKPRSNNNNRTKKKKKDITYHSNLLVFIGYRFFYDIATCFSTLLLFSQLIFIPEKIFLIYSPLKNFYSEGSAQIHN